MEVVEETKAQLMGSVDGKCDNIQSAAPVQDEAVDLDVIVMDAASARTLSGAIAGAFSTLE